MGFKLIFCVLFLCLTKLKAQNKEFNSLVIPNEWELVKSSWPRQDEIDKINKRNSQFFYINKNKSLNLQWKLKDSFVQQFKDESQIFKLSFKYWSNYVIMKPQLVVLVSDDEPDTISNRYYPDFKDQWMQCEYLMSYKNLKTFNIHISRGDDQTMIAFKDFQIEYETHNFTDSTPQQTEEFSMTEWEIYSPPASIPTNENQNFMYFSSNCTKGCIVKSGEIKTSSVSEVKLSFKYWIKGNASIQDKYFNDSSEDSKWILYNQPFDHSKSNVVELKIRTIKTSLNEESFVAIKDLRIEISYGNKEDNKTTPKPTEKIECLDEKSCKWKSDFFRWPKPIADLEQKGIYYYPKSKSNSLEILRKDDLNKKNVCYTIEYWASYNSDTKINVNFNIKGEKVKDKILTIRPKTSKNAQKFEKTKFCLRDLIALNVREYVISFNVEQYDYTKGINGFALKINDSADSSEWKFEENTQKFLQPMEEPFKDDNVISDWRQDWIQLSPQTPGIFEFQPDHIEFTATAESKATASVQLISKWIVNDPNLRRPDPQYSINVKNPKLFNAFKIRPKVCDWLSHCTDVIQKIIQSDQNSKTISFEFNPMKNSHYIKLLFYIEYFQPSYEQNELEIKFDLKLIHFGNPCFNGTGAVKCENNGTCSSDFKKDIPNKPICSCTQSWTGSKCEIKNNCGTINNKTKKSGSLVCHKEGDLECESLENGFRCACDKSDNITWDDTKAKCTKIDPQLNNWTSVEKDSHYPYYPNSSENFIVYKFKNINTTKFDICITMEYQNDQIMPLRVGYINQTNELFSISLPETQSELKFCLSNFLNYVKEEFDLSFSVLSNKNITKNYWNATSFQLENFSPRIEVKTKRPVSYIKSDKFDQWTGIPDELFPKHSDPSEIKFQVHVNSSTPSTALLISDWIEYSKNFSSSLNLFEIHSSEDDKKCFKLTPKILFQINDTVKYEVLKFDGKNLKVENKLSIPTSINSTFKLIFEITYNLPEKMNATTININFTHISVGDPCFSTKGKVCTNGECKGLGPNNYFCDCSKNDTFGGKYCNITNSCANDHVKTPKLSNENFCRIFPSLPNIQENKCIPSENNKFECKCIEKDYIWKSETMRCSRIGYDKKAIPCEGKNCPFLDTILSDTKWSSKNIPKIDGSPFYFSSKNDTPLIIQVNNLDDKKDACFQFEYQTTNGSDLMIGYNNFRPITLSRSSPLNWYPKQPQLICARSLAQDIDPKSFNITFVPKVNSEENDLIALKFLKNSKSAVDPIEINDRHIISQELPYLTHWSFAGNDTNFSKENQWPLLIPYKDWSFKDKDSIEFKAEEVSSTQTSYLMSNWLKKDIDGYKLRFKISSEFKNFAIQIIVYDNKMEQNQVSNIVIGDNETDPNAKDYTNQTATIPINKMKTPFRVAFKVVSNNNKNIVPKFTLNQIDLGDPCVFDNTTYNLCTGNGKCNRTGPINSYKCECDSEHEGTNCELINYCKSRQKELNDLPGQEYCQNGYKVNCINNGFGGFRCNCTNGTYWDFTSFKCKNDIKCTAKKCNDYKTQDCKEPVDPNKEVTCECKENYINVSTTTSLKCEKFDPCNELHRNRSDPQRNPKPCGESNAICISLGDKIDDYTCVCPRGYERDGDQEDTTCEAKFCEFPSLNTCEQKCDNLPITSKANYNCSCGNSDLYERNGDKCKLRSGKKCNCKGDAFCDSNSDNCNCKKGYKTMVVNNTIVGCEPDLEYKVPLSICPDSKLTNTSDNKLACDCGSAFKLNKNNTCDLKPICGKDGIGRKDCDSQNALCILNEANKNHYECKCPPGKELYSEDKNSTNSTCVDFCSFGRRIDDCKNKNAECNPLQNNTEKDFEKLCYCRNGFYWKDDKCVMGLYTVEFSLSVKNTFYDQSGEKPAVKLAKTQPKSIRTKRSTDTKKIFSADLNGYFDDLKSTNIENNKLIDEMEKKLGSLIFKEKLVEIVKNIANWTSFKDSKERIVVKECEINSNFYNCLFTISLQKPLKDYGNVSFNEQLLKLCILYPEEPESCFFPKPETTTNFYDSSQSDIRYSLVIDKEKLAKSTVKKYNLCEELKNRDMCLPYAKCVDDKELSTFSCICNEKYFTNGSFTSLDVEAGGTNKNAIKYECKQLTNLCSKYCPSKNGRCEEPLAKRDNKTGDVTAEPHCECEDKYLMSNTGKTKSCVGVCEGVKCNHGKCVSKGSNGYACECEDNWSGINCDSELKASYGGWIAGIVVLAVLLVVASGIALIFYRRSSNSEYVNNSGHQLDEYPRTSYRVETSGSAATRSQPAFQGRDNQSFNRD